MISEKAILENSIKKAITDETTEMRKTCSTNEMYPKNQQEMVEKFASNVCHRVLADARMRIQKRKSELKEKRNSGELIGDWSLGVNYGEIVNCVHILNEDLNAGVSDAQEDLESLHQLPNRK
jgi:hypothetical protein